jgi:hypothetical protein
MPTGTASKVAYIGKTYVKINRRNLILAITNAVFRKSFESLLANTLPPGFLQFIANCTAFVGLSPQKLGSYMFNHFTVPNIVEVLSINIPIGNIGHTTGLNKPFVSHMEMNPWHQTICFFSFHPAKIEGI